jgi:hypothetical protein
MRFIRFDSVGGASGDMLLGALASIGADLNAIERVVRKSLPEKIRFHCEPAADGGLHGLRVSVHGAHAAEAHWPDAAPHSKKHSKSHAPHRTLKDIAALLDTPALDAKTRKMALTVFQRLAAVEAEIHGKTPKNVHFHEIGALDSIADIVGCCLALRQLDVAGITVGPLPCGVGTIQCAHGAMPNPAPATMALLAGMEIAQTDEPFELVTPTGAALLATWRADGRTPPAVTRVVRTGFGFGRRTLNGRPNVLRATLLEPISNSAAGTEASPPATKELLVLETNLDDCNPQWIGDLIGRLLDAGALDAWAQPITMKKGRPGFVLGVLCAPDLAGKLREMIFRGTTTFGIRSHAVTREILDRRFESVTTPFGKVSVKIGSRLGEDLTSAPEFEECARAARQHGVSPRQVHEAAVKALGKKIHHEGTKNTKKDK